MVRMTSMGLLAVGHVDLATSVPALADQQPVPMHLVLAGNLQQLLVVAQVQNGQTMLCSFDVGHLRAHGAELQAATLSCAQTTQLMSYLQGTVKAMGGAWESILLELDTKLTAFAAGQNDGPQLALDHEFLDLLTRGFPRQVHECICWHCS